MLKLCKAAGWVGIETHYCEKKEAKAQLKKDFEDHLEKYHLSYGTKDEHNYRYSLFREKDEFIKQSNDQNESFKLAHNEFSTYNEDEYSKMLGGAPQGS